MLVWWK